QPKGAKKDVPGRLLDFLFGWLFRLFNAAFRKGTAGYTRVVGASLRGLAPLPVIALAAAGGWLGWQLPLFRSWLDRLALPAGVKGFLLNPGWVSSELRMAAGVIAGLLAGVLLTHLLRRGGDARLLRMGLTGSAVVLLGYGGLLANTWY